MSMRARARVRHEYSLMTRPKAFVSLGALLLTRWCLSPIVATPDRGAQCGRAAYDPHRSLRVGPFGACIARTMAYWHTGACGETVSDASPSQDESNSESGAESAARAKSVRRRTNNRRARLRRTEPATFRYENDAPPARARSVDLTGSIEQFAEVIRGVTPPELSSDARAALNALAATLARLLGEESPGV